MYESELPELTTRVPSLIYCANGKQLTTRPPKPITGKFLRQCHFLGRVSDADSPEVNFDGTPKEQHTLVRMQVPWLVTLMVYESPMQQTPTNREYVVYAPPSLQAAVTFALKLWNKWEAPRATKIVTPMGQWPRIEDGCVAEPLEPRNINQADDMFKAHFKDVVRFSRKGLHFLGHREDPVAFTSLDPDLRLYKVEDFQQGLEVKIN